MIIDKGRTKALECDYVFPFVLRIAHLLLLYICFHNVSNITGLFQECMTGLVFRKIPLLLFSPGIFFIIVFVARVVVEPWHMRFEMFPNQVVIS